MNNAFPSCREDIILLKSHRKLEIAIQSAVSVLLLAMLFRVVNVRELATLARKLHWQPLVIGLLVGQGGLSLRALRWQWIVNKDRFQVRFREALAVTYIGTALNVVMPANTGEIGKSYYGYRMTGLKEPMLSASLFDKIVALLAAFVLGAIASPFQGFWASALLYGALTLATAALVFAPGLVPWKGVSWLASKLRVNLNPGGLLAASQMSNRLKATTLLLSLIAWGVTFLQMGLVLLSLEQHVGPGVVAAVCPLIIASRLFPLTLDGLGSQEAAALYLLGLGEVPHAQALAASFLFRIVGGYVMSAIGAVLLLALSLSRVERGNGVK